MRLVACTAFFVIGLASPALAQQSEGPVLGVSCTADKVSYARGDTVNLTITLENRGPSEFYVYRTLEWGWAGLRFKFTDATGHRQPAPWLGIPPPPPPVSDKSQLVGLAPDYFFGTRLTFGLSRYNLKPGTYYLQVAYQSNYRKENGLGLPILTFDDGEFRSNKIQIHVRPK